MESSEFLTTADVTVCTTFGVRQWSEYAHRTIPSYLKHWPTKLVAYYQNVKPDLRHALLEWRDLEDCDDFRSFRRRWDPHRKPKDSYRFEALRFAHKVYALSECAHSIDHGWLLWWDADVVTTASPTAEFWGKACPAHAYVSFLGRPWWRHSECGFMAFNLNLGGRAILEEMRDLYDTDKLYDLKEWHDSYVFDCVRNALVDPPDTVDLAAHLQGPDIHVWPNTVLGAFSKHYKGNRKNELRP